MELPSNMRQSSHSRGELAAQHAAAWPGRARGTRARIRWDELRIAGMLRAMSSNGQKTDATTFADTAQIRVVPHGEWDALVEQLGGADTYMRLGYHLASLQLEVAGATAVLLHVQGVGAELAVPLLLRPLPAAPAIDVGPGWDATSAYGYGGPVARDHDGLDAAAFGVALDEWAITNGVVATFLRFHPLLGNYRLAPATAELIELGATVAWDIAPARELLPGMHSHHRRAVRKADRAGLEIRIAVNPAGLDDFRELYEATMCRQQAQSFYFFSDAYWDALAGATPQTGRPGSDVLLVEGLLDGEPVASLLCFADGPLLHYHLGASAEAARAIGASNRCFLAAAEWAQSRAMSTFHLGGGVGAGTDSPLFVFKQRYDPDSAPRPFHIAKLVHDPVRYRELAGTDSTAGHFPPWRAR